MTDKPLIAFYGFGRGPQGVSRIMMHLMRQLAASRARVDLLGDFARELSTGDLVIDPAWGIRVVPIPGRPSRHAVKALCEYMKTAHPSSFLANSERAGRLCLKARDRSGEAVPIALRIGTNNTMSIERRHLLQRWYRRYTLVRRYRRMDTLIAVSHGVAKDTAALVGIPESAIHVIPNPTIPHELERLASRPVDHRWLTDQSFPVIIGVGRLARPKGFDTLLRAFSKVRQTYPSRLVLLGEGKLRPELTALAKTLGVEADVDLPGYVDNPFAYLARASLFVLSSVWEGSPNVLIEALAMGVPTVSTDCPFGPREILRDGRVAPLVPVGDAERMADEMLRVLKNPQSAETLKAAVADYHPSVGAARYMAALETAERCLSGNFSV